MAVVRTLVLALVLGPLPAVRVFEAVAVVGVQILGTLGHPFHVVTDVDGHLYDSIDGTIMAPFVPRRLSIGQLHLFRLGAGCSHPAI